MRVLVIGGGGREHAIVWSLKKSPAVSEVWCAPGNAGIAELARCVDIQPSEVGRLRQFAADAGIDLTVVGPEAPLVQGIVDEFRRYGLAIFGPTGAAAILEGSKCFAKDLMSRYKIPTAPHRSFTSFEAARDFLRHEPVHDWSAGVVVKADGLAGGKGAFVCEDAEEAEAVARRLMVDGIRGVAGRRVVIEERLKGDEISVLAVCYGTTAVPIGAARDYKRLLEWDRGPNTGGMGAYSPVPGFGSKDMERVMNRIVIPTLEAMKAEGRTFSGVLYAGLMLTADGPMVLEYNVRFGDPETQVILPRLEGDLLPLLLASASGDERSLAGAAATPKDDCAVCVVMAKDGYPGAYEKGAPVSGLDAAGAAEGVVVFHAGTKVSPDGRVVTDGGRVLGVVGTGRTLEEARRRAYRGVSEIAFEGATFRRDIGLRLP